MSRPSSPVRSRRRRRLRRLIAAVIGVPVVLLGAGMWFYVLSPQSLPASADAVFVIGPAQPWRMAWAEQLLAEHRARDLVVSVPPRSDVPPECTGGATNATHVYCVDPDPTTTRGEARALKTLVDEHGWHTVTVITLTPHVTRAQARMDACVPNGVHVVGRPVDLTLGDWAYQFGYQTAGWIKLLFSPGC